VPSLGALQEALRDPDAGVRQEAMRGLSQIGLSDPRAIVALCDALGNPATHDSARSALAQANWRPGLRGMPDPGAREAVVPDLLNAMERQDDITSGIIAARVCRMVVDAELEDQLVSEVLRDSAARLASEVEHRSLAFRRHVLVGILNEHPSELLTPLLLELLRIQPDLLSEPASSADRRAWDEALGLLIDRARKHDPMIRNQLLIHLLPSELAGSLMPAFSEMIAGRDQELRNECLILNANLLNEARFYSGLSIAARGEFVLALRKALKDERLDTREWAAIVLGEIGTDDAAAAIQEAVAIEPEPLVRTRLEMSLRSINARVSAQDGKR
jgi:hypothetical protein